MKICSIASGSSGNCIYVEELKTKVLIDIGISGKKVTDSLSKIGVDGKEIDGILVTHDHEDHIKGVGILSRKYDIPIYANQGTWEVMKDRIGKISSKNIKYFDSRTSFTIKDVYIESFSTSHDAKDPVGFSIYGENKKMSIATDLGYINKEIFEKLYGADMLLLEANHDVEMLKAGPYPYYLKRRILGEEGHLSNESAGKALIHLVEKGLKRVLLAHLSQKNNFPELAYQTVYNILTEHKIKVGKDIKMDVAHRESMSEVYSL
ncbi:MBL fold metallo-hydrolase [Garciella nitratireducens]|uniref:Phosphoribosyl 1,2-cyclic phosphodiesterase n=1 Tax=Garciella nitratireducens DSM 15102 TaxID=1121911 RepID=A0A1T4M6Q4_9FIRM|nr:MBL fold metallo-hydrolase [Garciella nitratireducens]RBP44011.1 phosphoribosyl 1,2-cyclic phosphodiesterase [Garciella nitratireducens]SJZ62585.1 Phosphoribosyl 1,2-cyclic phosphodiesterase [Garciella nitratireducens DSM 15102]